MKLRTIRVFLAVIFFIASLAYLIIGPQVHPMAVVAEKVQIIPSALSATIGVTAFWFVATFLFGRVYCSTVCPIGTLQDCAISLRRRIERGRRNEKRFRFRQASHWRYDFLIVYLLCLLLGISAACYIVEPWNIMRNIASIFNRNAISATWATLSLGVATGMAAGVVSLIALLIWAWLRGREFCNTVCPIGTAMGAMHGQNLFHIEIDPDRCTSCLKCEDICPGECIKVVSRYVDNSRCTRCFDCVAVCPDNAIRYQINRNRRFSSPLMRRRKSTPG